MVMAIHTNSLLQGDGIKLSPLMCISYNCAKDKPLRQRLMEWPALHVTGTAHCFSGKAPNGQSFWRQGDSWWACTSHHILSSHPKNSSQRSASLHPPHEASLFLFLLPFPLMNELQSRHFRGTLGNNMHPIIESFLVSQVGNSSFRESLASVLVRLKQLSPPEWLMKRHFTNCKQDLIV